MVSLVVRSLSLFHSFLVVRVDRWPIDGFPPSLEGSDGSSYGRPFAPLLVLSVELDHPNRLTFLLVDVLCACSSATHLVSFFSLLAFLVVQHSIARL